MLEWYQTSYLPLISKPYRPHINDARSHHRGHFKALSLVFLVIMVYLKLIIMLTYIKGYTALKDYWRLGDQWGLIIFSAKTEVAPPENELLPLSCIVFTGSYTL